MLGIATRQLRRSRLLAESQNISRILPLIVTLRDESLHILENGIAIVPIHRLTDFILNWEGAKDRLAITGSREKQEKL